MNQTFMSLVVVEAVLTGAAVVMFLYRGMLDMKEGSSPRCRVVNGAHRPGGDSLCRCAPVNSAGIASRGQPAQRMLRRLSTHPHSGRRGFSPCIGTAVECRRRCCLALSR